MAKFKFEIMNNLGAILQDEEFKVAYYILNRLALENTKRVKIYRAMLADLTNKSERTISRITDKLDEKGIIKKDTVSDSKNRYNYYSIHPNIEQSMSQNDAKLGNGEPETTSNLVTDDTFNKSNKSNINKSNIKVLKVIKSNESNKVESVKAYTFEDFQNEVETLKDCKDVDELLTRKAEILTALNSKRLKLTQQFFNRCNSYLQTKYKELEFAMMQEATSTLLESMY